MRLVNLCRKINTCSILNVRCEWNKAKKIEKEHPLYVKSYVQQRFEFNLNTNGDIRISMSPILWTSFPLPDPWCGLTSCKICSLINNETHPSKANAHPSLPHTKGAWNRIVACDSHWMAFHRLNTCSDTLRTWVNTEYSSLRIFKYLYCTEWPRRPLDVNRMHAYSLLMRTPPTALSVRDGTLFLL